MKTRYSFLALVLIPVGLSFAQAQSATTTKPAATSPGATTSTGTSANRQQELYDQYHGISKKPATSAPARTETPQPAREMTRNQPVATASSPQRSSLDGSTGGVRIGLRAGVTYPIYTETQPLVESGVGFVGGVTFNFGGGTLSFQPEVNYSRYSQKIKGLTGSIATDIIEVPLFLKIASGTYDGNRFFVNVGPYAAYLASASIDGKKVDISNSDGRFGFGAALGVGAALKAGPGHVTIEVRGNYALGTIDEGFSTDSNTILGQVTLGYMFPLGGR